MSADVARYRAQLPRAFGPTPAGRALRWLGAATMQDVAIFLPRFQLSAQFQLVDALKALGMILPFDSEKADLSGISDSEGFALSAVIHKAYIDVNEEGTEAVAATGVVGRSMAVAQSSVFRADRPFIFLIRDNTTESILFLGRLTNPEIS